MITDQDIDNAGEHNAGHNGVENGGDEATEGQSLPARLMSRLKAMPMLAGAVLGVFVLAAFLVIFAGTGDHAGHANTEPVIVGITAEEQPVAAEPVADAKPEALAEDSAPTTQVPVVAEVAVLISDVGISRRISDAIIKQLPTLTSIAVSPYATNTAASIATYRSAGNDVWLQLATRSTKAGIDSGPLALSAALASNENQTYMQQQLAQAGGGFVGLYVPGDADITQDANQWKTIALDQIGKNLMILDATTAKVATELYVPKSDSNISAYLKADVVVQGDQGPSVLKNGLQSAIPVILREREAIVVISRPTILTITQTAEWLKTLRDQGIELVPASRFTGLKP